MLSNFELNFFIILWSNLKETLHYITLLLLLLSYMVSNIKNLHVALEHCFLGYENKRLKYEAIWQHFLISGKHRAYPFLIFVCCPSQLKKFHYNRTGQQFFNAPCKRVTSSWQKRKHNNILKNFFNSIHFFFFNWNLSYKFLFRV